MQCGRCGKKLRDPESIRIGYGPTCRFIMGINTAKQNKSTRKSKGPELKEQGVEGEIPGQMSIMDNPNWLL